MPNKIKNILRSDAAFYGMLVILVAVTAYGLGRQSVPSAAPSLKSQEITMTTIATTSPNSVVSSEKAAVVASKNGSKYHLSTCPGANQIKEENKVFFDSTAAAKAAGYSPAANCPGLD